MASIAKFDKVPLSEVVCGVQFEAPEFAAAHFGLYWQAIRDRFPNFPLDRPPIGVIEVFAPMPTLRRVWFESESRKQLIQIQSDRFHYNWRRLASRDEYPSFDVIYPNFEKEWLAFQEWWAEIGQLPPRPMMYEMTYLNKVDSEFGWCSPADTARIFTFLGRNWDGFLDAPTNPECNLMFHLPAEGGTLMVRLNQVQRDSQEGDLMLFELTARSANSTLSVGDWFEGAHDFIVKAFIDLISDDAKEAWGFQWIQ